jgi:hypothetical protein
LVPHGQSDGTPSERPPAPSVKERPAGDLQAQTAREFYTVLERLGAEPELDGKPVLKFLIEGPLAKGT